MKKTMFIIQQYTLVCISIFFLEQVFGAAATTEQLAAEASVRRAADSAEMMARQKADLAENTARKAADLAEKTARQSVDTIEKNERIAHDNALSAAITSTTHQIGEQYGGGKVFYIYDNGQHGLIAAMSDQVLIPIPTMTWHNTASVNTFARGDGIGAGKMNTAIINAAQANDGTNGFAARIAIGYQVLEDGVTRCADGLAVETCIGDWYLPSKAELNLMFSQKSVIGGFTNSLYWSSTEEDFSLAWAQFFLNGNQIISEKSNKFRVRVVREF